MCDKLCLSIDETQLLDVFTILLCLLMLKCYCFIWPYVYCYQFEYDMALDVAFVFFRVCQFYYKNQDFRVIA